MTAIRNFVRFIQSQKIILDIKDNMFSSRDTLTLEHKKEEKYRVYEEGSGATPVPPLHFQWDRDHIFTLFFLYTFLFKPWRRVLKANNSYLPLSKQYKKGVHVV